MSQESLFAAANLRKQADDFRSKQLNTQYTSIINEAKEAAASGDYSISYYGPISEATKEKLRLDGFNIEYKNEKNESWHAISW